MTQQLRKCIALTEDAGSVPRPTSGSSQHPVIPVLGPPRALPHI